jgi:hypothetical protein
MRGKGILIVLLFCSQSIWIGAEDAVDKKLTSKELIAAVEKAAKMRESPGKIEASVGVSATFNTAKTGWGFRGFGCIRTDQSLSIEEDTVKEVVFWRYGPLNTVQEGAPVVGVAYARNGEIIFFTGSVHPNR